MAGRSIRWSCALTVAVLVSSISARAQTAPVPHPKLVVMISVDQLRGDLLSRYRSAFTGGFARFLDDGYVYTQASDEHAVTETAAGHATLSTGVFPSRSGIVSNEWSQKSGGQWRTMYAVADDSSPIVGAPDLPGRSPKNLLRGGLADWIQAADSSARIVSISGKDRAAITFAGKTRGEVYWIAPTLARFVTSTYYRSEYPDWVTRFNERVMPAIWSDRVWSEVVPEESRSPARPDTASWEGDGIHTAFPHRASLELNRRTSAAFAEWAYEQPRQDSAVLLLAQEAVDHLKLGQREPVDFLGISLSATDYIGHSYGPLSQEQLDNLYRLDRELGAFLAHLDATVGPGGWVAGLSADHGVATTPEALQANGEDGERLDYRGRMRAIRGVAREVAAEGGSQDEIAERLARSLESKELVARAYTHRELANGGAPDSFATLFRNSLYPGRGAGPVSRWGVEVRFGYGQLPRSERTGTTHGTPYWYDRWVPLILLGAQVSPGTSDTPVWTVDLAPSLALLAGIPVPGDLDGHAVPACPSSE